MRMINKLTTSACLIVVLVSCFVISVSGQIHSGRTYKALKALPEIVLFCISPRCVEQRQSD